MGGVITLTQLGRLVTDYDINSLLTFNFSTFVFPASMLHMFTIFTDRNQMLACKQNYNYCQFFYTPSITHFGFKANYFSLSFPSLKLVHYLWLFTLCGHLLSTYFVPMIVSVWLNGCIMCIKETLSQFSFAKYHFGSFFPLLILY